MVVLILAGNVPQRHPGDFLEVRASIPGGQVIPPKFIRVYVNDAVIADFLAFQNKTWKCEVDYEVLVHQVPTDGYRIRVWNTTESVTEQGLGYARLTRTQIENYLNKWNGEVVDITNGSLRFDIGIYQMLTSEGFWYDIRPNLVESVFTENSYNETTGVHEVECDYSALTGSATAVEVGLMRRGATIISHADRVITFQIQRNTVLQYFKTEVKEKLEKVWYRRTRHHLTYSNYGALKSAVVTQMEIGVDPFSMISRVSGDPFDSSMVGGWVRWDDRNGSINNKIVSFINSDTLTSKGRYNRSGTIYWFEITGDESSKTKAEILADITDKVNE